MPALSTFTTRRQYRPKRFHTAASMAWPWRRYGRVRVALYQETAPSVMKLAGSEAGRNLS